MPSLAPPRLTLVTRGVPLAGSSHLRGPNPGPTLAGGYNHANQGSTMSSRLDNKIAIVTGAGSGIGRAAARRFAAEGAAVVCADVSGESAEQTAADVRASGQDAIASQIDVSKSADVSRLVDECIAAYG